VRWRPVSIEISTLMAARNAEALLDLAAGKAQPI
jgi:hypothetical protein